MFFPLSKTHSMRSCAFLGLVLAMQVPLALAQDPNETETRLNQALEKIEGLNKKVERLIAARKTDNEQREQLSKVWAENLKREFKNWSQEVSREIRRSNAEQEEELNQWKKAQRQELINLAQRIQQLDRIDRGSTQDQSLNDRATPPQRIRETERTNQASESKRTTTEPAIRRAIEVEVVVEQGPVDPAKINRYIEHVVGGLEEKLSAQPPEANRRQLRQKLNDLQELQSILQESQQGQTAPPPTNNNFSDQHLVIRPQQTITDPPPVVQVENWTAAQRPTPPPMANQESLGNPRENRSLNRGQVQEQVQEQVTGETRFAPNESRIINLPIEQTQAKSSNERGSFNLAQFEPIQAAIAAEQQRHQIAMQRLQRQLSGQSNVAPSNPPAPPVEQQLPANQQKAPFENRIDRSIRISDQAADPRLDLGAQQAPYSGRPRTMERLYLEDQDLVKLRGEVNQLRRELESLKRGNR